MFFPYGTDAPIYHWPIATVLLIVVCAMVSLGLMVHPEQAESLILVYGKGLQPAEWVTSNFVHADVWHLLGNMFSLWTFGLIVEGKLGWQKTLGVFLGIGIVECAIEQSLMLHASEGASYGASAVVFGFMAISLVWSPQNNVQCALFLWFRPYLFELTVTTMVVLMVALEIAIFVMTGMSWSSSLLHLIGAAFGFVIGIVMLKAKLVDCENWDLFSIIAGRHLMTAEERAAAKTQDPVKQQQREQRRQEQRDSALQQIREILHKGQPEFAMKAHQRMARELPDWTLPEADLFELIQALHKKSLLAESIPLMVEHLGQKPRNGAVMRLKLAQILMTQECRPAQARQVLSRIDPAALEPRHRELLGKLRAKAADMDATAPLETVEDW